MTGRITAVGAGVSIEDDLTLEGLRCLRDAQRIYTILSRAEVDKLQNLVQGTPVEELRHLYGIGPVRRDDYRRLVETILKGAVEYGNVAWLTRGHPVVFDSVTQGLLTYSGGADIEVSVSPGISSLDRAWADLRLDPADGVLVLDASRAIAHNVNIPAGVRVMLLQVNAVLSSVARLSESDPMPSLTPLRDYLVRFFAPDQRATFVRCGAPHLGPPTITTTTVGSLDEVGPTFVESSILCLDGSPPAHPGTR